MRCHADVAGHIDPPFAGMWEPRGFFGDEALEELVELLTCPGSAFSMRTRLQLV